MPILVEKSVIDIDQGAGELSYTTSAKLLFYDILTRGVQKDSIRFPIRDWPPSNVEYSTFDQPSVECGIINIRSTSDLMTDFSLSES